MQKPAAEAGWRDLYLVGGIATVVLELTILLGIVGYLIWPYTPGSATSETVFALIQTNPVGAAVSLDALLLLGNLITLPVFVALYVTLRSVNRSFALLALVMGIVAITLLVPARPIVEMFSLSRLYSAADAASQARILAAGDAMLAVFNGTSWAVNTFLGGLSLLISSLLMLKSTFYGRWTAYAGLATNAAACGFFLPAIGIVLLFLTIPGYMLWYALLAVRFFRAARS
jgi:hypothetical protein